MEAAIDIFKNHWAEIFIIVQTIARMTPTKADDRIVGKIGKALNAIFLKSTIKK